MKTETRWVITGTCGLYVGQWLTREAAIEQHCTDLFGRHYASDSWRLCRKKDDRAVKATITYAPTPNREGKE